MRKSYYNPSVVAVFLIFITVCFNVSETLAQTVGLESTPEASTAGTPEPVSVPEFSIVAVGDHPTGFFKDIEVAPGSSVDLMVAIVNTGSVEASLSTYNVNAISGINGGFAAGSADDPPIGATAWLDYPSRQMTLAPGEQQEILFTVTVPEGTAPGQYITGLIVETQPLDIPGSDVLNQVIAQAITVGILVPGELTPSFELGEPEIAERTIQIPFTNSGNVLVRPSGELTLTNDAGQVIHTTSITMGSVYAGLSTQIFAGMPEQTPPGDYTVDLILTDEESGATDSIENASVTVPEPVDPTGVSATSVFIEPNANPIAFANVAVTLNNGGQQIPAANVTLNVMRDGEEVESFPLATNQVLPSGETELSARYLPADAWEPGTYTFQIVISAVDPEGGTETILATIDVEDEIVVP